MGDGDETARDAEDPPEPLGGDAASREAALTAAILRIGASLDLDTALNEVGVCPRGRPAFADKSRA